MRNRHQCTLLPEKVPEVGGFFDSKGGEKMTEFQKKLLKELERYNEILEDQNELLEDQNKILKKKNKILEDQNELLERD